jgi:hypothetical protein
MLLVVGCAPQEGPERESVCANGGLSSFPERVDSGTVQALKTGNVTVVFAYRDVSVTALGICLHTAGFPSPPVTLRQNGHVLRQIGGKLTTEGGQTFQLAYFPPTFSIELEALRKNETIAQIVFQDIPLAHCSGLATEPFRLIACGTLVLLRWRTEVHQSAASIDLIDVETWDADTREPLGFFFLRKADGTGGLIIDFGILPPSSKRVRVKLVSLYPKDDAPVEYPGDSKLLEDSLKLVLERNWAG